METRVNRTLGHGDLPVGATHKVPWAPGPEAAGNTKGIAVSFFTIPSVFACA